MASSGEYYDEGQASGASPAPAAAGPANFLNLSVIRAFLWRQRLILIGVTALALIAGLIYTLLLPPVYTATATMRIESSGTYIVPGQEVTDPGVPSREVERFLRVIQTVMSSRSMALRVVDSLGLQDNPGVVGDALEGADTAVSEEVRRELAADRIRGSVGVDIPMNNVMALVSFSSGDPVLSARIANAYVDTFMEDLARQGAGTNSYALSYLEEQIQDVRVRLRDAERRAIEYARENRIVGDPISAPAPFDPELGRGAQSSQVSVSNLASVSATYTSSRAARIAAEEQWRAASNVPALQLPAVLQNGTVQGLRSRRVVLEGNLSDLRERYREDYPLIRETQAQIAELDGQINLAAEEIKDAIRSNYDMALRQEQALNRELERVSEETLDEQDRRVQYNIIDRDAEALRSQLGVLLSRYNQISAASNIQSESISWLDRARVPQRPSSPNLLMNLIVAFVAGAAIAAGIAVLREMFDDRVRTPDELERKLQLPALGKTPFVSEEIPEEIEDPFSPISEAYASIRATLDHAVRRDHPVVQVTSSEAGEGKTTSAVALARKYASIGRKVLLVDFDLRRPGLAKMFGDARPEIGVVDVLYSRIPLERALLPNAIENLDILPVGDLPENPVEIMSSNLVGEFVERYRGQYDVMILDSSPVMGIADAPLLSRHADAVAFVVEANRAQIGKAKVALRRLEDMNAYVVGLVLTKFRALEAGENYNYEQHYYNYNSRVA